MNKRASNQIRAILFSSLLTSCGYHTSVQTSSDEVWTISIPYISGDPGAILNNQLVSELSQSGQFQCVQSGGELILKVSLLSDSNNRIGYRYDRDNTTNKLEKNLIGVEDRRTVAAEVSLISAYTEEVLFGPTIVKASVEYDYVDSGSPRDLSFTNSKGISEPVIDFSLGQLDTVEGAHDDASSPLFRLLSQKITIGLFNSFPEKNAD